MSKRPAFQFYPSDWRKESGLKFCSLAAKGLWIEMLCIMHEGEPYGHLVYAGRSINGDMLAKLIGESPAPVKRSLKELADNNVFSTTDDGTIFSRRMVRDEDLRERRAAGGQAGAEHGSKGAEHGAKGGRPKKAEGAKQTPVKSKQEGLEKPPLKPPPSSSSSSSASQVPLSDDNGAEPEIVDWQKRAFDLGVEVLGKDGTPASQARSLVGRWRKQVSDERLAGLLEEARNKHGPVEWMTAAVKGAGDGTNDLYRSIDLKYAGLPPVDM